MWRSNAFPYWIASLTALIFGAMLFFTSLKPGRARAETPAAKEGPEPPPEVAEPSENAAPPREEDPPHLLDAKMLVLRAHPPASNIPPGAGRWIGEEGADAAESASNCSTFLTRLLQRAYEKTDSDIAAWLGSARPSAQDFHDHILDQRRMGRILKVEELRPGDILAVKYPPGLASTGHVMIAAGRPVRRSPTPPLEKDTLQYELSVIDSAKAPHGPQDTRWLADGGFESTAGIGTLRLYADPRGGVAGYSWSTDERSVFRPEAERHLVIGRLREK